MNQGDMNQGAGDGEQHDDPAADGSTPEPEMGYWERKAREDEAAAAAEKAQQSGADPNEPTAPIGLYSPGGPPPSPYGQTQYGQPQYGQPQYGQVPYGQPQQYPAPQYGQPQHGQPQYGQPQYGQPQYGQPQYGQPPYGQQYPPPGGWAPQPYRTGPPDHQRATWAMVLGIGAVLGAPFFCGTTLVLAPFAWALGKRADHEIIESGGQLGGSGQAKAGYILGIIGTVLLVLALIVAVIVVIGLAASTDNTNA